LAAITILGPFGAGRIFMSQIAIKGSEYICKAERTANVQCQ